jgi:hypothetical protein
MAVSQKDGCQFFLRISQDPSSECGIDLHSLLYHLSSTCWNARLGLMFSILFAYRAHTGRKFLHQY